MTADGIDFLKTAMWNVPNSDLTNALTYALQGIRERRPCQGVLMSCRIDIEVVGNSQQRCAISKWHIACW
jgi:hypothetical protein